ncbi:TPM domain-containing protein [Phyllobacterium myrsinacearum]|uniref:TPM domain-containing protein n=1 Tax=Phyllobacterium myrsinacearum TaxID=28101 RepID=UPI0015F9F7B4|nr:YgcG family protein [Phyllobacterium myrsinacearum]
MRQSAVITVWNPFSRRISYGLLLIPVLLGLFLSHVQAADLPVLTGRVVDGANVIDAGTRDAITQKLAAFEAKSSDQVVVVTVPSLDGEAIEPYSNRLYRAWALGQKQENNGVLLVVAPNDRKVRIEVGYGLEGTLTDLLSKLIIENAIIPGFRSGDYSGGIARGVDDILKVLSGDSAELEARAKRNIKDESSDIDWFGVIFISIWVIIFFGGFGMAILVPVFGQKIGPGRYKWLGMVIDTRSSGGGSGGGWSSGGGGGWSSGGGGGGFSGGGGSSGGGGASGSW